MTRILVTGSNGLLGTKLLEQAVTREDIDIIAAARGDCRNAYVGSFAYVRLDVADGDAVHRALSIHRPDVVIHTAAMTDVDGCELRRDEAWTANVTATEHVAIACREIGARLVHLSTEYVYNGQAGPYSEDDPVDPLGWYARTKWEGEQRIRDAYIDSAIARTTVLYGQAPNMRPNFVLWLLNRLRDGQSVNVVVDQVGSPTLADNLAQMILALALSHRSGVYHTVGDTVIGRYDFARLAARVFDLDETLVKPISTAELNQPSPRPLRAGLRMDRFKRDFPGIPVLGAEQGLMELKRQLARTAPV